MRFRNISARICCGATLAIVGGSGFHATVVPKVTPVSAPASQAMVLDVYGEMYSTAGVQVQGSTWNWPIARGFALRPQTASGYLLDGFGGVHALRGAPAVSGGPYWPHWDIARAIALDPCDGNAASGYVLDGFGGVHPFGGAPPLQMSAYWPHWDIARGIAFNSCAAGYVSGYVLDGYGGLHPVWESGKPAPAKETSGPYWRGWDIARAVVVTSDGMGEVLDGYGGIHPFNGGPAFTSPAYWKGWDIARGLTYDPALGGGYVLDGYGNVHAYGSAPPLASAPRWPGRDIAVAVATYPASISVAPPPSDFFPITVWLQTPEYTASRYKAIGVNTFSALWNGPTDTAMAALQNQGLQVMLQQQSAGLASSYKSIISAWYQQDEPDNAQPLPGGGYGPCVDPSTIVAQYQAFKAADPTRPVVLNFGQGVANIDYIGRGSACYGRTDMYAQYAQGADILSFDVYPVNDGYPITYVADGVSNLLQWTGGTKPVWAFIETTRIDSGNGQPSPAQVKAEVWLALTHGATGIQYFCHIFSPSFIEAGLLSDSAMTAAVGAIDSQIAQLAPVLNSPTVPGLASVSASGRIDMIVKQYNGSTYVFAVNPGASQVNAAFSVSGLGAGTVSVIGENRDLVMNSGGFGDTFAPYAVHLYQIG